jgi:restriction system protein
MNRRDPAAPWNYLGQVEISPGEFELRVKSWIENAAKSKESFECSTQGIVKGSGGDYKIDVLARMKILGGAEIVVLAECKNQKRAVERDEILILEGKLRDVGAHKGMLFSTAGFQRGAIDYTAEKGIAAISVIEGQWLYETKSADSGPIVPPSWVKLPHFAGICLHSSGSTVSCHAIDDEQVDAVREFLTGLPR